MGTRGSFGVRINGQDKLTYNHFSSDPGCLGVKLVGQFREMVSEIGLEGVKELASKLRLVNSDDEPTDDDIKEIAWLEHRRSLEDTYPNSMDAARSFRNIEE